MATSGFVDDDKPLHHKNVANPNSCRFCLAPCKEHDIPVHSRHVQMYANLLGRNVEFKCLPRKICRPCIDTLKRFDEFRNEALKIEKLLRNWSLGRIFSISNPDAQLQDLEMVELQEQDLELKDLELEDLKPDVANPRPAARKPVVLKRVQNPRTASCPPEDQSWVKSETLEVKLEPDDFMYEEPESPLSCEVTSLFLPEYADEESVRNDLPPREEEPSSEEEPLQSVEQQSFDCSFCHQSFTDYFKRVVHVRHVHPNICEFKCDICGRIFKAKHTLIQHMKHHRPTLDHCTICDKYFKPKNYKSHLIAVHGPPLVCQHCGKTLKNRTNLKTHIEFSHSDVSKLRRYQCTECPASVSSLALFPTCIHSKVDFLSLQFLTNSHLKRHMTVHTPQPVPCETCGKIFPGARYLKQHLKTHVQTDYNCPLCPTKTFSLTTTLRAHIKSIHHQLPLPPPGTVLRKYDWAQELEVYRQKTEFN